MASKRKKRMIAVAALLLVGGSAGGAYQVRGMVRARALERARVEGLAAYERGEYREAMAGLGRYVARNRSDAEAVLMLSEARRRVPEENGRHLISAMAFARAAHQAAPEDVRPLEVMLELAQQVGFQTELREIADKLLALNPAHFDALMARIVSFAVTGDLDRALECANEAVARHPESAPAHEAVIRLLHTLGKEKEAGEYAAETAKKHPALLSIALLHAQTAAVLKDSETAIAACRHAATMRPSSKAEFGDLLRFLRAFDLNKEAQELIDWARSQALFASEAEAVSAEIAWKAGYGSGAAAGLSALPVSLEERSEKELGVRAVLQSADRARITEELATRTTSLAAYWSQVLAGIAALDAREYSKAETTLKSAVALNPWQGYAQYFLGETYTQTGSWRRAVDSYAAAASTDPAWRAARSASLLLLMENGELRRARDAAFDAFVATRQLGDGLLFIRASVLMMEAGQADEQFSARTLREIEEFEARYSELAIIAALKTRALLAMGKDAEAITAAERLLALPGSGEGSAGAAAAPPPMDSVARLSVAFQKVSPEIAQRFEGMLLESDPEGVAAPAARATQLAIAGRTAEADAIVRGLIDRTTGEQQISLRVLRARMLDGSASPEAKPLLAALAAEYAESMDVQLAVLEARSTWIDEALIEGTLKRLSSIVGKESEVWRQHDARRLLAFDPTPANAARVVDSLAEIGRGDPGNTLVAFLLADAHLILEDRDGAIEHLTRTASAVPGEIAVQIRLVALLQQSGRSAEAATRLATLRLARGLPVPQLRQRAQLLAIQGMRADASADLAELASRGEAQDRLAYALERADAGDAATARGLFEGLLSEKPVEDRVLIAAARFLAQEDGAAAGLALLEDRDSDVIERVAADIHENHGDPAQAEAILRKRATSAPPPGEPGDAWAELAQFYLRQGKTDEAAGAVESGLKLAAAHPTLTLLRGVIGVQQGSAGAGREDLNRAMASPSIPPDARLIAEAYQKHEDAADPRALVAALRDVTRKFPTSYLAWRELTNTQASTGDVAGAVQSAAAAVAALPADPRAAALSTEVLTFDGQLDAAASMAQRWRTLILSEPLPADLALARIEFRRKDYAASVAALVAHQDDLIENADTDPESLGLLAASLAGAGRVQQASDLLLARAKADTAWRGRYYRVTEALMGSPDAARAWLNACPPAADDPPGLLLASAEWWSRLAVATRSAADLEFCVALAERAAAADPGATGAACWIMGTAYSALDRYEEAAAAYRRALEAIPDSPEVMNNLAHALTRSAGSEEAVLLATRAVELVEKSGAPASDTAPYRDTLGVALLALDRFGEAEATFEAALRSASASLSLLVGLAEAQHGGGKREAASATLARITVRSGELSPALRARVEALQKALAQ